MKWQDLRRSRNVVDRRNARRTAATGGGLGLGGMILVLAFALLTGQNPLALLGLVQQTTPSTSQTQPQVRQDENSDFVQAILGDTEVVWGEIFAASGQTYQEPELVLFSEGIESACGFAGSAAGPFYCPGDSRVYMDLSFFGQLEATAGEEAEFARAYVIAHEVAHHVQNRLGILAEVQAQRRGLSTSESNALQVRVELQADCLAGVWGHYTAQRGIIEQADINRALQAAAAVGDDHLQRQSRGRVVPESFTHGTSEQRMRWFSRGLASGDPADCGTFNTSAL
jgi:predicted metalloprotease